MFTRVFWVVYLYHVCPPKFISGDFQFSRTSLKRDSDHANSQKEKYISPQNYKVGWTQNLEGESGKVHDRAFEL